MSEPGPVARPEEARDNWSWVVRGRVGHADVAALADFTSDLRVLDHRHGGGRFRDAAVARLPMARALPARVQDHFERSRDEPVPGWAAFSTAADLSAMTGAVYTEPAQSVDPRYVELAMPALSTAIEDYGPDMVRSKVLPLCNEVARRRDNPDAQSFARQINGFHPEAGSTGTAEST